ncbi:flavin reductase family protein [Pseudomonas petrae]|uniref:Flavin reductase family protein n=1 Tax=Pseudomonas petrae TaxID=2912190 RepID=A0ABS9IDS4_9PSED|nr:flavin reductase family protein [Pseudomonas petrae]MCF7545431.1 flavin reductase family protein [Pseudomonas petrae]
MFYQPGITAHGLPHDPFKSCVVPRPIGWISTRSVQGVDNLAPYSQFTNVSFDPAMVMFSSNQTTDGRRKDTVTNAEQTGVFIWNMATWGLREQVNVSAEELPPWEDEFIRTGLLKSPGVIVAASRVAASPVQFECEYMQTVRLPGNGPMGTVDVVFGRVVGVHIADSALTEGGKVDVLKLRPLARMGYFEYTSVESSFEMVIPGSSKLLAGLEGSALKNSGSVADGAMLP